MAWQLASWRRQLRGLLIAAAFAPLAVQADAMPPCDGAELAYVGTDGKGLRALSFDACAGRLAMLGSMADLPKPRWVLAHPQLPLLYVAVDGGGEEGRVLAFTLDRSSGGLKLLNEIGAGGAGTTHLSLDMASQTLLAANFGGGSVSSIALGSDGSLGPRASTLKASGSGPHRRQTSPHAHGVSVDLSGRYALVADMGADRVFVYGFERSNRQLLSDAAEPPRAFVAPAGSGPRRAVFGHAGNVVYVLNELSAEILVLRWDATSGRLSALQSLPVSSAGFAGVKSASELALSRDGRFVYVADRGESTLQVYRVHPDSGELALLQRLPSGGDSPWAFDIHPSGRWLLVANYRSQSLNLFSVDAESGLLADTGESLGSPGPVSVLFVK